MNKLISGIMVTMMLAVVGTNNVGANTNKINDRLTDTVVENLERKGTELKIVEEGYINEMIKDDDVKYVGWCEYTEEGNIIYVEDVKGNRDTERIALHEYGHAFDKLNKNNRIYSLHSTNDDFIKAYELEKDQLLKDEYYKKDTSEYFAESFSMFFYSSETKAELKEKAPMTYEYIEKVTK